MKKGRIELVHNFTGETQYVILTWHKTSAPLTEIGRQVYPAPHSQETLLIEDLDPVMHFVRAYRSVDGIALNTQINELACDAGARAQYLLDWYEYIVDRGSGGIDPTWDDPVNGSVELRDERLKDQLYQVSMRGTGIRRTDEITDRSDAGGGFDLATGEVFNSGDSIFVTVQNRVDIEEFGSGSGSGAGGEVADIVLLESDDVFDSTMFNKLIVASFSGNIGILDFPNFLTIPDCYVRIQTHGGSQKYLRLRFDVGDSVVLLGEPKNIINLGRGEEISLLFRNNVCYVLYYAGDYRRLGQRIWGDRLELNSVFRDGTQYNQSDQPRMMEFVDSLDSSQIVSEAQWASVVLIAGINRTPYKGFFARDNVAGTIRVPDDRDRAILALKTLSGAADPERHINRPGGYQTDFIRAHKHTTPVGVTNIFGAGNPGTRGHYGGTGSGDRDFTDYQLGYRFDANTRPQNTGMYPLLII